MAKLVKNKAITKIPQADCYGGFSFLRVLNCIVILNNLVKQRTKELEDINEILMMDIEYAKEMQRSLLPAQLPKESAVTFIM